MISFFRIISYITLKKHTTFLLISLPSTYQLLFDYLVPLWSKIAEKSCLLPAVSNSKSFLTSFEAGFPSFHSIPLLSSRSEMPSMVINFRVWTLIRLTYQQAFTMNHTFPLSSLTSRTPDTLGFPPTSLDTPSLLGGFSPFCLHQFWHAPAISPRASSWTILFILPCGDK